MYSFTARFLPGKFGILSTVKNTAVKNVLFIIAYLLLSLTCVAQGQNNVWTFGEYAGLNFNSGTAMPIADSIESNNSCASAADKNGNLLFYTNGFTIWDKTHHVMPNGSGLANGLAPAYLYEGTIIVPFVRDSYKYFVFTVPPYSPDDNQFDDKLYYSVVDMRLNNGKGDVVSGMKDIVVDSGMTTPMISMQAHRCGTWLVTHQHDTSLFKAFRITDAGPGIPVVSATGTNNGQYAYQTSVMKRSSDYKHIALTNFTIALSFQAEPVATSVELYNFDTATGVVSNCKLIDMSLSFDLNNFCGVSFSPDNTKLYATELASGIYQYDLTLPTLSAITASKYNVSSQMLKGDMEIGPDGKIYVGNFGYPAPVLDRIDNPNGTAAACNYVTSAMTFTNGTVGSGFPQKMVWPAIDTLPGTRFDTVLCKHATLTLNARPGYLHYLWQNNATDAIYRTNTNGTFWVNSWDQCAYVTDSFKIDTAFSLHVNLGNDTSICPGFTTVLDATNAGAGYLWNDLSTMPTLTVNAPGTYYVTASLKGCTASDTIVFSSHPDPFLDLGDDTTLCTGESYSLNAGSHPNSTITWQDGSHEQIYYLNTPGLYYATVNQMGCIARDSVQINYDPCDCPMFIADAFTPNNDGLNDKFAAKLQCTAVNYDLMIFNRWGQNIYRGRNVHDGWDGTFNGSPADVGVYFYELYVVTDHNRRIHKNGTVTLVR